MLGKGRVGAKTENRAMPALLFENARILTLAAPDGSTGPRRGAALGALGVIERGWVLVENGLISSVGSGEADAIVADDRRDVAGHVLMPGLIDCHTHACWAGCRFDEFAQAQAGASYLEILKAGGGIMSTVRAVREASALQLTSNLLFRLEQMARLGTTTVEVKSGYGLSTQDELKMLEAIHAAAEQTPLTVVASFLGAHAIDRENSAFIDETINVTLPEVVKQYGPIACDAYCEEGAWSLEQTRVLFDKAKELGCPIRIHTDQFNSLGATQLALDLGARSVDHLEATTAEDLERIGGSDTIAVLLPASGYQVDDRYAPGRALVDLGAAVAVASNCNPGSAPSPSLAFSIQLAVKHCRLTPEEAITAATYNAACVLGLQEEHGSIEPGKRADFIVLDSTDERSLGWEFAGPGPQFSVIGGACLDMGTPAVSRR